MHVILGMIPGLFLGVQLLLTFNARVAEIIAGLVVMGAGGVTLLAPKLQFQSRWILPADITFGFLGGILGGLAAILLPARFPIGLLVAASRYQKCCRAGAAHQRLPPNALRRRSCYRAVTCLGSLVLVRSKAKIEPLGGSG